MIILSIKTDQPESEFTLFNDLKILNSIKYQAHRDLGLTIHQKISDLLKGQKLDWSDVEGVICFKGPGSFTGLRIGLSVANALAYGLGIPIVGEEGEEWQSKALNKVLKHRSDQIVIPFYGADPHITEPRK